MRNHLFWFAEERKKILEDYLQLTVETYNAVAPEYVNDTQNRQPEQEFEAFCQEMKPQGVVLDAGCGGGRDSLALAQRDFSVIGIDLSEEMLKLARRSAPGCKFIRADLRNIPCEDASIDGIWCCASLLHLKRSQVIPVLQEFKRVLKIGAICCILVKEGAGEEMVEFSQEKLRFFTYFQRDEMLGYCLAAGFRILDEHVSRGKSDRHGRQPNWLSLLIKHE